MKIISVGEILWNVIGRNEHLGGAPFNFAVHAAYDEAQLTPEEIED